MKLVRASAPGNLFFCGEHAVVYGFPGIVSSVGCRAYCTVKKAANIKIVSELFGKAKAKIVNGRIENVFFKAKELEPLLDFVRLLSKKYEFKTGLEIYITSGVPAESGMSSSTAVLCSLLSALDLFFDWNAPKKNYFDLVFPVQKKIHGGKASGSEIVSSSVGGFNKIQKKMVKGKTAMEFEFLGDKKFFVVIGNTLVKAPTALTVGMHVPSLMKRNPGLVKNSFKKIEAITKKTEKAVKQENVELLGSLMNENQKILSRLGLSHPKLDDCIAEALNAGAIGAKLSGGGWGGIMFALCKKEKVVKVKKAIQLTGAKTITTNIGGKGAKAWEVNK